MKVKRVLLQPAFTLHARPHRENSLLVSFLTMEYGRISLWVSSTRRKKSPWRSLLQPFTPLLISFSGKTELCTLQHVETLGLNYGLAGPALFSGFYLNELLIKLLPEGESYLNVFNFYQNTLENISQGASLEIKLRLFEKNLLKALGYEIDLTKTAANETIESQEYYSYEFGNGFAKAEHIAPNFSGKSLLALAREDFQTQAMVGDAKRLMRTILTTLLQHRPLKSRELFYFPED